MAGSRSEAVQNAIPIVEVARELREQGHSITDAAFDLSRGAVRALVLRGPAALAGTPEIAGPCPVTRRGRLR